MEYKYTELNLIRIKLYLGGSESEDQISVFLSVLQIRLVILPIALNIYAKSKTP